MRKRRWNVSQIRNKEKDVSPTSSKSNVDAIGCTLHSRVQMLHLESVTSHQRHRAQVQQDDAGNRTSCSLEGIRSPCKSKWFFHNFRKQSLVVPSLLHTLSTL